MFFKLLGTMELMSMAQIFISHSSRAMNSYTLSERILFIRIRLPKLLPCRNEQEEKGDTHSCCDQENKKPHWFHVSQKIDKGIHRQLPPPQ